MRGGTDPALVRHTPLIPPITGTCRVRLRSCCASPLRYARSVRAPVSQGRRLAMEAPPGLPVPAVCCGCMFLGAVIWLARVGTPQPSGKCEPMRSVVPLSTGETQPDLNCVHYFMARPSVIAPNVRRVGIRPQGHSMPRCRDGEGSLSSLPRCISSISRDGDCCRRCSLLCDGFAFVAQHVIDAAAFFVAPIEPVGLAIRADLFLLN